MAGLGKPVVPKAKAQPKPKNPHAPSPAIMMKWHCRPPVATSVPWALKDDASAEQMCESLSIMHECRNDTLICFRLRDLPGGHPKLDMNGIAEQCGVAIHLPVKKAHKTAFCVVIYNSLQNYQ